MSFQPYQLIPPLGPSPWDPTPYPTALAFDPYADLLFVGTSAGTVVDFCGATDLVRHATYTAHGSKGFGTYSTAGMGYAGEVKQLDVAEKEVWSLTEGGIAGVKRGGLVKWTASDPLFGMKSFASNPVNSHEVVVGGAGPHYHIINASQGKIVKRVDQIQPVSHLHALPRAIVTASPSGIIQILDPRQNYKQVSILASTGSQGAGLSGIDIQGDTMIAWGWDLYQGQATASTTLRLYDLRTSRLTQSIEFQPGISFAKIDPAHPDSLIMIGSGGQIEIADVHAEQVEGGSGHRYQSQLEVESYVTAAAISAQGDYLAVGDASGQVHMLTTHDLSEQSPLVGLDGMLKMPPMNGYEGGLAIEWPDTPVALPDVKWTSRTPLNMLGMPYYGKPLLSNFSISEYATASSPILNPPQAIPPTVLSSMRVIDGVGYAPLPKELKGKRNVVCQDSRVNLLYDSKGESLGQAAADKRNRSGQRRESGPKFRSEKAKKGDTAAIEEEASAATLDGKAMMPKYYRQVEIKYSKFGVEDFDFEFYNKTRHSGLETHISNSYTNSLLQAYHYSTPVRAAAKAHITVDCHKENCMLCEAGFLFRMLEDAKGINCQASNFSRAFGGTAQAAALGLFVGDDNAMKKDYANLIQRFNRWLTTTFAAEDNLRPTGIVLNREAEAQDDISNGQILPHISQVMALQGQTESMCLNCRSATSKQFLAHVVDLVYPRRDTQFNHSFASVLKASLSRETTSKASCPACRRPTTLSSRRKFRSSQPGRVSGLPSVLSLNACVISDEHLDYWRERAKGKGKTVGQHFLPERVFVRVDDEGDVDVREADEDAGPAIDEIEYRIKSVIASVQADDQNQGHLVAFVNTTAGQTARMQDDTSNNWLLFNDFLVREVSQEEVLSFTPVWKHPGIVVFERVDHHDNLRLDALPTQLDTAILLKDSPISSRRNRGASVIRHACLHKPEIPVPGTLVAIDAEFIALQLEELEIRSDGTKKVLRPTKMSLARVSVLRGSGGAEGKPFIDDYIHTSEPVVDYLTEFSGIKEGDLDPNTSKHTLVPLKNAYKKLRLLVDLGCIFIGHGLPKDFRTINIFVPPAQVIDTVAIYFDPSRHRKLSLRFLSWFLLKQDIQTAEHDSIEDARCALQLYKKYLGFVEENRFEDVMEDIFDSGQRLGFKPPQTAEVAGNTASPRPSAPSTPDIIRRSPAHTSGPHSGPMPRPMDSPIRPTWPLQGQSSLAPSPRRWG